MHLAREQEVERLLQLASSAVMAPGPLWDTTASWPGPPMPLGMPHFDLGMHGPPTDAMLGPDHHPF